MALVSSCSIFQHRQIPKPLGPPGVWEGTRTWLCPGELSSPHPHTRNLLLQSG